MFETPLTYQIMISRYGGGYFLKTRYYSLPMALRWYHYYNEKYKARAVADIYAFRGDTRIGLIREQQINELYN